MFPESKSQKRAKGSISAPFLTLEDTFKSIPRSSNKKVRILILDTFGNFTIPLTAPNKIYKKEFELISFFKTINTTILLTSNSKREFGLDIKANNIKFSNIVLKKNENVQNLF